MNYFRKDRTVFIIAYIAISYSQKHKENKSFVTPPQFKSISMVKSGFNRCIDKVYASSFRICERTVLCQLLKIASLNVI